VIVFGILAVVLVGAALMVVTSKDAVHAVLWLAVGLISTAGAYVALSADFIAAVQLMLYAGGVITLMLFAVMLTDRLAGAKVEIASVGWARGLPIGLAFFGLVAAAVLQTELPTGSLTEPNSQLLGELFLTRHVAAFEALSVLLLAAMIGAIVIARRKDA
jgi:NADH:ubiquinone oxidoreductase subunit 6 (subunit J)